MIGVIIFLRGGKMTDYILTFDNQQLSKGLHLALLIFNIEEVRK
jgi:hypothetical protein